MKTLISILVLLLGLSSPARGSDPALFVDARGSVVTSATPRGEVAIVGVGREQSGFETFVRHVAEILVDEDGDGEVRYESGWSEGALAVWASADIRSGVVSLAVPEGQPLRQVPDSPLLLTANGTIAIPGRTLDLLLVRPRLGAWTQTVVDGGPLDLDTVQDGIATLDASVFRHPDREPPDTLAPGDVLVAIHANTLVVQQMTLGETTSGMGGGEVQR